MRKPRLMVGIILLLMIITACTNAPETQVVLVVTATFEPATETALAAESLAGAQATEPAASDTSDAAVETPTTETATPLEITEQAVETIASPSTLLPGNFPTPLVTQIQVAEQLFEHGRMFWLQPNDEIWVMIDADDSSDHGRWIVELDTFVEGETESDPRLTPPVDGVQPTRGFGKLWRDNDAMQEALGWGVSPEFGFVTTYEYRAGGYLDSEGEYVPRPGIHILVSLGNEAFAFEEATSTWRLIE